MSDVLSVQRAGTNRSRSGTGNTTNSSEASVKSNGGNKSYNTSKNDTSVNSYKKNRQNLVLSTSFVSTKRLESAPPSPASPLQGRFPRNSVSKALLGIRSEINQLQLQLAQTRKNKENAEKLRDSAPSEIYKGAYSTDHLQKHSMRIRANTQIRELDTSMKKTEKQIAELKQQLQQAKKVNDSSTKPSRLGMRRSYSSNAQGDLVTNNDIEESSSFGNPSTEKLRESCDSSHLLDTAETETEYGLDDENNFKFEQDSHGEVSVESENEISPEKNHSSEELPLTTNIETATWLISDFMQSLQDTNITAEYVLKKANGLVALLKEHPGIRKNLVLTSFMGSIQALLLSEDKRIISAAYRVCRYLINSASFVDWLIKLRLDAFIVISLAKDASFHVEREQALRLVRAFLDFHANIPKSIVQAIISCIEKQDDSLKNMALETLLELCFVNPRVVSCCQGMRVLESMLKEYSTFPVASIILDSVLQLMSTHGTRKHFLEDFYISVLFTAFSDSNTKASLNVEKMQNATLLISKALKDHNGLMLFSMGNFQPLKELMSFFQVPLCAPYLIDIFLDVLRIKKISHMGSKNPFKLTPSHFYRESMLINQHIALIVLIMYKSHFIENIGKLLNRYDEEKDISETLLAKARYLLSEYMNLAMNLLSEDISFTNKLLPFYRKTYYDETFEFGKMFYTLNKKRNTVGMEAIDVSKNVLNIPQSIKETTMGRKVDDLEFRRMVYDSKVLQTKNFSSWNWNVIQELLEGPLLNGKQLDELVKSTKFIRRLLIFYRPLRLRFSNVNKGSRLSHRYIQVGCQFFRTLTSTSVGMKILADDTKIIPQLASLLFRSMERNTTDNIININTLKTKVVDGYFKFVGVLTQSSNGITYLKKWSFFTVIYKMFENSCPISLKFLLLTLPELDLKYSGHCRTIMGKSLVYPQEDIRIQATQNLGEKLIQLHNSNPMVSDIVKARDFSNLQRYSMEMLTRQLYDLSPKVVAVADQALYNCIVTEELSLKVGSSLRTSLRQMVFIRSPILFELMSTSYGFQILNEINFIQDERESWLKRKNLEYVSLVENFLNSSEYSASSNPLQRMSQTERLPQHFYESLAKTEDGIALIGKSDDLSEFISIIKQFRSNLENQLEQTVEDITLLKSALWCVGYIGSTELGVGLLDNYSLVEDIIQLAYGASETTVRYTAFMALGLTSKTKEGCEILDEMGWNCCLNVQASPIGITYPNSLDNFLSFNEKRWSSTDHYEEEMIEFDTNNGDIIDSIPPIELNLASLLKDKNLMEDTLDDYYMQDLIRATEKHCIDESLLQSTDFDDMSSVEKVLDTVSKLGNHILSNAAIKEITEMNNEYGSKLFESEIMFTKVMEMMSRYRFKPHVRKFLCGLFINKKALANVIRHDRKIK